MPPGDQALAAEVGRARLVDAVERQGLGRLAGEVDGLGRGLLHLEGQLVAGDPGGQLGVVGPGGQVVFILRPQPVEQEPPGRAVGARRRGQVVDRHAVGTEHGRLKSGRHVAARPVLRAADRTAGPVEHHHEARQVFVFASQAVVDPGAQAGVSREQASRIHHQHGRAMDRRLGIHRVNEGDVVDTRRQVREQAPRPTCRTRRTGGTTTWGRRSVPRSSCRPGRMS